MKKHDRPEPRLELQSFEPGYVTITARIPRPAPGAEDLDIESTGRHAISSLVRRPVNRIGALLRNSGR